MDSSDSAAVSRRDLDVLRQAVEWADFLDTDTARSDLLDPCCMLEALSDVYGAARRLVDGGIRREGNLASGSAP